MRRIWFIPAWFLFLMVLAACEPANPGGGETQAVTPGSIPVSAMTATTGPDAQIPSTAITLEATDMAPLTTPNAAEQQMVDLAKAHLAKALGIAADEIDLVEVKPVVWRDGSLGCPKPAIDYIQVETPGYRIQLSAAGTTYTYHTDETRRVVTCKKGG